jgi:predicted nucleotidyltransferase component of viral defense system
VLQPDDRDAVAGRFGADDGQVERDHLISHLLSALAGTGPEIDGVVFFGGTALARTHLPDGRLSEDIDLYVTTDRRPIAERLTSSWPAAVRREFPRLRWTPTLTEVRDVEPALLVPEVGAPVRIQLLGRDAVYARWPTEVRDIDVRYRDVAPVRLRVPTRRAFAAMKAAAWRDRRAARDLFDLAALATIGAIDRETVDLLARTTGVALSGGDLASPPSAEAWHEQLAHQCRLELEPETALRQVRAAWGAVARW